MTKPDLTNPTLSPISLQNYKRYIPSAFDESLTLLQKVNKVIDYLNQLNESQASILDNWNQLVDWIENGSITEDVATKLNEWLEDGTLSNLAIGRFSSVGDNAIKTKDSLYLPNDANLFGYHPDGTWSNLATLQQNDLIQYGDMKTGILWFESNNYQSLRAPNSPSYQKTDINGNSIESGRTIKHQGNSSYHLRVVAVGEHVLVKDSPTDLHTLTNVLHVFPPSAYNNFAYIIPREGMYTFNLQLKIKNAPLAKGIIRISASILSEGNTSIVEFADLAYDPTTYGTPFLNAKFDWKFKKDDQVTIKAEAKSENITIGEGTRLQIYNLGDTIQV